MATSVLILFREGEDVFLVCGACNRAERRTALDKLTDLEYSMGRSLVNVFEAWLDSADV